MNNRNEIVKDKEELRAYVVKMIENAKKHGVEIGYISVSAPMGHCGFNALTYMSKGNEKNILKGFEQTALKMVCDEIGADDLDEDEDD